MKVYCMITIFARATLLGANFYEKKNTYIFFYHYK